MKSLLELTEASKDDLPEIYCDLDEVLVDFIAGANKAVGGEFVTYDKEERWKKVNQTKGFGPILIGSLAVRNFISLFPDTILMFCLHTLVVILLLK